MSALANKETAPDPWLTVEQAAQELQVHPATLRRQLKRGLVRFARLGTKAIRLRRSWLVAAMEPVEVARR